MISSLILWQGVVAFVAVSIDEFFVLITFFLRAHDSQSSLTSTDVVLGQLLGFTLVLCLSLIIGFSGLYVPAAYVALLGIFPVLIGCHDFFGVVRFWYKKSMKPSSKSSATKTRGSLIPCGADSKRGYQSLEDGGVQLYTTNTVTESVDASQDVIPGDKQEGDVESDSSVCDSSGDGNGDQEQTFLSICCSHCQPSLCSPNVLLVTATVLAEGSEELAIFAPLCASVAAIGGLWGLLSLIIVFYFLVLLQCFAAYLIVYSVAGQRAGKMVAQYSKNVTPLLLIALGMWILHEGGWF